MTEAAVHRRKPLVDRFEDALSVTSSIAVLLLTALLIAEVVARLYFKPIAGTVEVAQAMMVAIVYLGLGSAQRNEQHITVTFIVQRLHESQFGKWVKTLGLLLAVLAGVLWAWQALRATYVAWDIGDTTGGIRPVPLWPSRLMVALGVSTLTLRVGIQFWESLTRRTK